MGAVFLYCGFPLCFSENNHHWNEARLNRHVCCICCICPFSQFPAQDSSRQGSAMPKNDPFVDL